MLNICYKCQSSHILMFHLKKSTFGFVKFLKPLHCKQFLCFFICNTTCLSLFFLIFAKIMCLRVMSPKRVMA